jgi:hypothetical protein
MTFQIPRLTLSFTSLLLDLDIDKLLSHKRSWGPSVRTCIMLVRGHKTVAQLERDASNAAAKFASNPKELFTLVSGYADSDDFSNTLFAIKPEDSESRDTMRACIPTDHLNGILALAVARFDAAQQSLFFGQISSHPWTKGSAGWIFEKLVHMRLMSASSPPLICISTSNSTITIPVCDNTHPLNGKYALRDANKHELPFYWRPTSTTFTSIDGIVCTDSQIFLIQATVASKHDINEMGLDTIFNGLPVKFREKLWCLVFITPTEECARGLRNQTISLSSCWMEKLNIYSCTFMVGDSKLNDTEIDHLKEFIVSY